MLLHFFASRGKGIRTKQTHYRIIKKQIKNTSFINRQSLEKETSHLHASCLSLPHRDSMTFHYIVSIWCSIGSCCFDLVYNPLRMLCLISSFIFKQRTQKTCRNGLYKSMRLLGFRNTCQPILRRTSSSICQLPHVSNWKWDEFN